MPRFWEVRFHEDETSTVFAYPLIVAETWMAAREGFTERLRQIKPEEWGQLDPYDPRILCVEVNDLTLPLPEQPKRKVKRKRSASSVSSS